MFNSFLTTDKKIKWIFLFITTRPKGTDEVIYFLFDVLNFLNFHADLKRFKLIYADYN